MQTPQRYVMQDQVRDRVRAIMAHNVRRQERRQGARAPTRWLALVAAAAYTAALAFSP
jgi:hypothetical protein